MYVVCCMLFVVALSCVVHVRVVCAWVGGGTTCWWWWYVCHVHGWEMRYVKCVWVGGCHACRACRLPKLTTPLFNTSEPLSWVWHEEPSTITESELVFQSCRVFRDCFSFVVQWIGRNELVVVGQKSCCSSLQYPPTVT